MTEDEKRQMALDCMKLIQDKISHKMTKEEYYVALMELHKKYPMPGHDYPLTPFQHSHYYDLKEKNISEKGVEYGDHLYPLNFEEAAQMYIRHAETIDKEKPPQETYRRKVWGFVTKFPERKERLPYKDDVEEVPF